jgi:hypothetical protein
MNEQEMSEFEFEYGGIVAPDRDRQIDAASRLAFLR